MREGEVARLVETGRKAASEGVAPESIPSDGKADTQL